MSTDPPPPPPAGCARDAGHPRPRACPWRHLSCSGSRECTGGRRAPGAAASARWAQRPHAPAFGEFAVPKQGYGGGGGRSTAHGRAVCCICSARREVRAGGDQPPSAGGPVAAADAADPLHTRPLGPRWDSSSEQGLRDEAGPTGEGGKRRFTGVTLPHTPRGGTTVGVAEWRW